MVSVAAALELATIVLRYRLAVFEALPAEQKTAKAAEHEARLAVGERLLDKIVGLIDPGDVKNQA